MTTIPTGEIKIKVMQNIWGGEVGGGANKEYYGRCANGEFISYERYIL